MDKVKDAVSGGSSNQGSQPGNNIERQADKGVNDSKQHLPRCMIPSLNVH